jgi:hypothetical protein
MKKLALYTVLALLLVCSAYAACYDSDDGPKNLNTPARYLGIDGFVTEGNTTYYDVCVSRKGGSELEDSLWIREYYCDSNGNVDYEDYFCPSHYYVECLTFNKAAACDDYSGPDDYNETSATTNTTNNTNTTAVNNQTNASNVTAISLNCGDGKVNNGEDCDPPGKTCYTKSFLDGVCDFNCLCDASLTPELFKRLNQSLHEEEDDEDTGTATVSFAVNQTKEEAKDASESTKNTSAGITGAAVAADPIDSLLKEARAPSEDFSDSIGIKITSAITDFVMGFWNILMNMIGG